MYSVKEHCGPSIPTVPARPARNLPKKSEKLPIEGHIGVKGQYGQNIEESSSTSLERL